MKTPLVKYQLKNILPFCRIQVFRVKFPCLLILMLVIGLLLLFPVTAVSFIDKYFAQTSSFNKTAFDSMFNATLAVNETDSSVIEPVSVSSSSSSAYPLSTNNNNNSVMGGVGGTSLNSNQSINATAEQSMISSQNISNSNSVQVSMIGGVSPDMLILSVNVQKQSGVVTRFNFQIVSQTSLYARDVILSVPSVSAIYFLNPNTQESVAYVNTFGGLGTNFHLEPRKTYTLIFKESFDGEVKIVKK